jgi:hypothetical protein
MPDDAKKQVKNASSKQLKLEIGVSPSGGVAGGAGGAAISPVFKYICVVSILLSYDTCILLLI